MPPCSLSSAQPHHGAPRRHYGGGARRLAAALTHGRGRGRYRSPRAAPPSAAPHRIPGHNKNCRPAAELRLLHRGCGCQRTARRRGVARCAAKRRHRLGGAEAVLPGERDVGALVPFFWSCGLGATVVPHYAEVAPATQ